MLKNFRNRPNLKREITLILIFKAIAIYAIWALFFSHPLDKQLTPAKVSAHLLGET
jgi:hypothetical protein